MNFQEFEQTCKCYNCNAPLTREKPLAIPGHDLISLKCNCVYSFKIPYDKVGLLDSFSIHLPICEPYARTEPSHLFPHGLRRITTSWQSEGEEIFQLPVITISADTGKETFEVKFHSEEASLIDNNKYFRCNYIPDWMSLPKEELLKKLDELLVFL